MSLRHALLGLLWTKPSSGYELVGRFEGSLGNAWHASHSQIYPELARLREEGMAEVVGEGPRNSRTWAATDAGRAELRRWLTETEPNRSIRNETGVRWFVLFLLDPDDRRAVLERELAYVDEEAARLDETRTRIDADGGSAFRPVVDLGIRMDAVMQEWLREQIDATREP
ncbi:MAG: transcriptional regulator, PadR-like family [Solirubrobacterales bacterium]|jgi:PadR family transcriptional regulator AphA|nr:transcriptional regulator, PadR-like family [Solirubrobacterales bacterium]